MEGDVDSKSHIFSVADVVILAKCIGEKKTGTVLEKFSIGNFSSGRSVVKKIKFYIDSQEISGTLNEVDVKFLCRGIV